MSEGRTSKTGARVTTEVPGRASKERPREGGCAPEPGEGGTWSHREDRQRPATWGPARGKDLGFTQRVLGTAKRKCFLTQFHQVLPLLDSVLSTLPVPLTKWGSHKYPFYS